MFIEKHHHEQTTPARDWEITHPLIGEPIVDILVNDGGVLVKAFPKEIEYEDSKVTIRFTEPQTGKAILLSYAPDIKRMVVDSYFDVSVPALPLALLVTETIDLGNGDFAYGFVNGQNGSFTPNSVPLGNRNLALQGLIEYVFQSAPNSIAVSFSTFADGTPLTNADVVTIVNSFNTVKVGPAQTPLYIIWADPSFTPGNASGSIFDYTPEVLKNHSSPIQFSLEPGPVKMRFAAGAADPNKFGYADSQYGSLHSTYLPIGDGVKISTFTADTFTNVTSITIALHGGTTTQVALSELIDKYPTVTIDGIKRNISWSNTNGSISGIVAGGAGALTGLVENDNYIIIFGQ